MASPRLYNVQGPQPSAQEFCIFSQKGPSQELEGKGEAKKISVRSNLFTVQKNQACVLLVTLIVKKRPMSPFGISVRVPNP